MRKKTADSPCASTAADDSSLLISENKKRTCAIADGSTCSSFVRVS